MSGRTLVALIVVALLLGLFAAGQAAQLRLPGDNTGYAPEQPIRFSHRLHSGELAIDCLYCHTGAERSRHAGIPAVSVCFNCHKTVTAPWSEVRAEQEAAQAEKREPRPVTSPEIRKVLDAWTQRRPIEWTQVHKVPDFVTFQHRAHVNAGVACDACHGPVRTMERVRQVSSLSMGWCVDCHRGGPTALAAGVTGRATTDCAACHN